ncbi:DUF4262 domain-containing protein [Mycobacteroides abscessus subsp. abscessus]|nr:DUF4262 domain-containing protein [Mycobacteroides abscessus subsp. abscessus]
MTTHRSNSDVDGFRRKSVEDTLTAISRYGWSIIGVFPPSGEPGVSFSYTVGLQARGLPELAMYGLRASAAGYLLNTIARAMVERGTGLRQGDWVDFDGAPGRAESRVHDEMLVCIEMQDTSELNMVRSIYGEVKSAVQLVWPTRDGLMPWELDETAMEDQPIRGVAVQTPPLFRARPLSEVSSFAELDEALSAAECAVQADPPAQSDRRARWAAAGFIRYASTAGIYGLNSDDLATNLGDFLSDLRHLADALEADWGDLVRTAERNYRAEIHESF